MELLLKDKVKRFKFFICINILLATLIGVYAQNITCYIVGDSLARNQVLYWLTILTVLSIVLFVATPIFINRFIKKHQLKNVYLIRI